MKMPDAWGDKKKFDIFESSKSKWVDSLDGIIIDHQHRNVLWSGESVARYCVDPGIAGKCECLKET